MTLGLINRFQLVAFINSFVCKWTEEFIIFSAIENTFACTWNIREQSFRKFHCTISNWGSFYHQTKISTLIYTSTHALCTISFPGVSKPSTPPLPLSLPSSAIHHWPFPSSLSYASPIRTITSRKATAKQTLIWVRCCTLSSGFWI